MSGEIRRRLGLPQDGPPVPASVVQDNWVILEDLRHPEERARPIHRAVNEDDGLCFT